MTTSFTLVQELLSVMRVRAEQLWTSEEQKKDHYEAWGRLLQQAKDHAAVESELQVIQKLTGVMDMQDKRESEEFHLSNWAAWRTWDQAKLVAEKYLIEQSAGLGIPASAFAELADQFPTVESRVQPGPALAVNQLEPAELSQQTADKVLTETASNAEGYFKKRAEAMGRELKTMGVPLKHGQILKLLAVAEGYKGFSALKVALSGNRPGYCPHCGAAGTLKEAGSVYCEQGEWDGKNHEAEGNGEQYRCTRCQSQFTDWCGLALELEESGNPVPDSFDVNLYETRSDWMKSNRSNLGTFTDLAKATELAKNAFRSKPFTVRIVNNRTGNEVDF